MAATNSADLPLPPSSSEVKEPRPPLSRRQLLIGAAGGLALVATNTATSVATHQITARIDHARAQAQLKATRDELQAEIHRLEMQLALYKDMERIGLDRLIRSLLEAYDRFWPALRAGISLLQKSLRSVDEGLSHFENSLPTLRSAAQLLGDLLTGLEAQTKGVQETLNDILKRTGPISEAVSGFLSWLLSRIPFGVGERIIEATDRLSALVANVPTLIADTRQHLLEPLQNEWLNTADGEGLKGRLFDPLRTSVLIPLRTHLEQVENMASRWDGEIKPIRAALDEREKLRQQLALLEQPAGNKRG